MPVISALGRLRQEDLGIYIYIIALNFVWVEPHKIVDINHFSTTKMVVSYDSR
jgi:hypothetical protein